MAERTCASAASSHRLRVLRCAGTGPGKPWAYQGRAACVLATAAIAVAGLMPLPSSSSTSDGRLRLTVFDVGQAEAILVQPAGAAAVLIDSGGAPFGANGFDIGGRVLAPAMWARGARLLHAQLVTHGDPDHLGGARAVLADFAPAHAWEGIPVFPHRPLQEWVADARARGIPVTQRLAGERFSLGSARVRVLHPPPAEWERPRVRNDDSVVMEVVFGDVAVLLTGDISADIERAILPQLTPSRLRILKVAHHGSRTSSSRELLEGWRPQVALISCGRGNTFGHPATEVLQRLEAVGATVYRTDRDGQITVETDGSQCKRARSLCGRSEMSEKKGNHEGHGSHEEHDDGICRSIPHAACLRRLTPEAEQVMTRDNRLRNRGSPCSRTRVPRDPSTGKRCICELRDSWSDMFESERPVKVVYGGIEITGQRVDLIVEGLIVVELKAVVRLDDVHRSAADFLSANDRIARRHLDQFSCVDPAARLAKGGAVR